MNLLACDIGGTALKLGVVSAEGDVLAESQLATPPTAEAVLAALVAALKPWRSVWQPAGLAVSSLGLVDAVSGDIRGACEAISAYDGLALGRRLSAALALPVSVENDVNCVALAEGWRGAARGCRDFLAVAIGTNIGGGIVADGRLYRGAGGAGGEWGYMLIDGRAWEDQASLRALVAAVAARTGRNGLDGRAVFRLYDAGDQAVRAEVGAWYRLLATGIVNLVYAFNPARVVLGGGIAGRGQLFLAEFMDAFRALLRPDFLAMTEVVVASSGNQAGLIGAVRHWLDSRAERRPEAVSLDSQSPDDYS